MSVRGGGHIPSLCCSCPAYSVPFFRHGWLDSLIFGKISLQCSPDRAALDSLISGMISLRCFPNQPCCAIFSLLTCQTWTTGVRAARDDTVRRAHGYAGGTLDRPGSRRDRCKCCTLSLFRFEKHWGRTCRRSIPSDHSSNAANQNNRLRLHQLFKRRAQKLRSFHVKAKNYQWHRRAASARAMGVRRSVEC